MRSLIFVFLTFFLLPLPATFAQYFCPKCGVIHSGPAPHTPSVQYAALPSVYSQPQPTYYQPTATVPQYAARSAANHPPFSNKFNYPRAIDATLQARAQREATLLAQNSYERNQASWRRNSANGHPIGVPPGYRGGTGCSGKGGTGVIYTCEPPSGKTLRAEAVARSPVDGTWYASRIWDY